MITEKEAWRFSLLKWDFFRKYDYNTNIDTFFSVREAHRGLIKVVPEIETLLAHCGLCEFFPIVEEIKDNHDGYHAIEMNCEPCPLFRNHCSFRRIESFNAEYWLWRDNPSKETADDMYQVIKKLQPPQWAQPEVIL